MPVVTDRKENYTHVSIIKKMKDYSDDPVFKKKAENATAFLKKHGMPKAFKKKK